MVVHIKEIKALLDQGQRENAHQALDKLLFLGPGNVEALKLKSALYATEGKFSQEAQMWERVFRADDEDVDAHRYFQRHQLEERETFYFTDHLATGGRRFLAHPRALIQASLSGLGGCVGFLFLANSATKWKILATPVVSFGSFALLILLPWLAILAIYLRCLREVLVTPQGLQLNSRLRKTQLSWQDVNAIYLAHSSTTYEQRLFLILVPKSDLQPWISIDLSRDSSSLRARRCFIQEVTQFFREPKHVALESLHRGNSTQLTF